MKTEANLISIIIATYNRAAFIGKTLDSILKQTVSNWEVLIVDDGGDDNTKEILSPYLEDPRISFFKRPANYNKGCPGARNYGLTKARGEYIWFFDDDDIAHPKLLEICYKNFQEREIDFCRFGRTIFYDINDVKFEKERNPQTTEVSKADLKQMIIGGLPFNSCQVIWKKNSLGSSIFDDEIIYADDWEFYTRLLAKGLKGISISTILLHARKHANSSTAKFFSGDKKILDSVISSHCSVISIANREGIMDKELLQFFFRKAILYRSREINRYLLQQCQMSYSQKLKYKYGFKLYRVIKPIFKLKSRI